MVAELAGAELFSTLTDLLLFIDLKLVDPQIGHGTESEKERVPQPWQVTILD